MVTVYVSALMVVLMAVVWAGLEASVLGVNLMVTVCVPALVTEAVGVLGTGGTTVNVNAVGHQLGGERGMRTGMLLWGLDMSEGLPMIMSREIPAVEGLLEVSDEVLGTLISKPLQFASSMILLQRIAS